MAGKHRLRLVETPHGNPARENLTTFHNRRGYRLVYRSGMDCPGCGRTHWYVGRTCAECAFCTTALPLRS